MKNNNNNNNNKLNYIIIFILLTQKQHTHMNTHTTFQVDYNDWVE